MPTLRIQIIHPYLRIDQVASTGENVPQTNSDKKV
jgi:hypothetical protein